MPTIKKAVKFSGVGIHSGEPVNMVIKPSDASGIFFRRVDIDGSDLIQARFDNVGDTKMRNTTVGNLNGAHVKTIEHLMAALFIAGIDSAIVEIDGPETPILDGSASEFYEKISKAGVTPGTRTKFIVRRSVIVYAHEVLKTLPLMLRMKIFLMNLFSGKRNDGYVEISPSEDDSLNINAVLIYPEKIIGRQSFSYKYNEEQKSVKNFIENIASARTFGKFSEWEYLKKRGMARGASEKNVIALNTSGDGTLNKTFWPDEFVRHKIIDIIGDMATSGGIIIGNIKSYKGSHALNNILLKKLFSNRDNYDIISAE